MQYREGTAEQFATAKETETLDPRSFYLIDGKPHLALTTSTAFAFVDQAMVLQMIAGLSLGGGGGGESGLLLGTTSGLAPTKDGTVGTSNLGAREDHTHPAQTSITGNANTATSANKLTNPRTIRLTGAVTGSGQFGGEADCTIQTTLSSEHGGGVPHWFGTWEQLPPESERKGSNTIYMVYENR